MSQSSDIQFTNTSLQELMTQQPLPWPRESVRRVGVALTEALSAAHQQQNIHGSLAPQWICFDADGTAIIEGFGWLLQQENPKDIENTQLLSYLAPEACFSRTISVQGDIYGLAAILYHLATGSAPRQGQTLAELQERFECTTPSPPSTSAPDFRPLDDVFARALNPDPHLRFHALRDFIEHPKWSVQVRIEPSPSREEPETEIKSRKQEKETNRKFTEPGRAETSPASQPTEKLAERLEEKKQPSWLMPVSVITALLVGIVLGGASATLLHRNPGQDQAPKFVKDGSPTPNSQPNEPNPSTTTSALKPTSIGDTTDTNADLSADERISLHIGSIGKRIEKIKITPGTSPALKQNLSAIQKELRNLRAEVKGSAQADNLHSYD